MVSLRKKNTATYLNDLTKNMSYTTNMSIVQSFKKKKKNIDGCGIDDQNNMCFLSNEHYQNNLSLSKTLINTVINDDQSKETQTDLSSKSQEILDHNFQSMIGHKTRKLNVNDIKTSLVDKNKTNSNGKIMASFCDLCSKQFKNNGMLLRHNVQKHSYLYSCNVCNDQFKSKKMLQEHRQKKHSNKYSCNVCNDQFKFKKMLLAHKETQHKTLQSLNDCNDNKFTSKKILSKNNMQKQQIIDGDIRDQNGYNSPAKCDICYKTLAHRRSLKSHMARMHKVLDTNSNVVSTLHSHDLLKNAVSNHSNKVQMATENLKLQLTDVSKEKSMYIQNKNMCMKCKKSFLKKLDYKLHLLSHYCLKCEMCNKVFKSQLSLEWHKKIHSEIGFFICGYECCSHLSFCSQEEFSEHLKSHVNNNKNY